MKLFSVKNDFFEFLCLNFRFWTHFGRKKQKKVESMLKNESIERNQTYCWFLF